MRCCLALFALFALLVSPAVAQPSASTPQTPIKFIDMGAIDIRGTHTRPKGINYTAKQRPVFHPLHDLKRDFLARLPRTAKDVALR